MNQPTAQEAFKRLTALCARAEYCEHDLIEKMRRWGVTADDRAAVMARLVAGRYVDDSRYAAAFVHDKTAYSKWGRRKIEQALRMKHISDGIIDEALGSIDTDEQAALLRTLLEQKRRTLKADTPYLMNMKLMRFAASRGFTMDVIRQCINNIDEE